MFVHAAWSSPEVIACASGLASDGTDLVFYSFLRTRSLPTVLAIPRDDRLDYESAVTSITGSIGSSGTSRFAGNSNLRSPVQQLKFATTVISFSGRARAHQGFAAADTVWAMARTFAFATRCPLHSFAFCAFPLFGHGERQGQQITFASRRTCACQTCEMCIALIIGNREIVEAHGPSVGQCLVVQGGNLARSWLLASSFDERIPRPPRFRPRMLSSAMHGGGLVCAQSGRKAQRDHFPCREFSALLTPIPKKTAAAARVVCTGGSSLPSAFNIVVRELEQKKQTGTDDKDGLGGSELIRLRPSVSSDVPRRHPSIPQCEI